MCLCVLKKCEISRFGRHGAHIQIKMKAWKHEEMKKCPQAWLTPLLLLLYSIDRYPERTVDADELSSKCPGGMLLWLITWSMQGLVVENELARYIDRMQRTEISPTDNIHNQNYWGYSSWPLKRHVGIVGYIWPCHTQVLQTVHFKLDKWLVESVKLLVLNN